MGFGQNENASALKDSNKAVGQFWICRLPGNQAGGRAPKQRARRDEGDWGGGGGRVMSEATLTMKSDKGTGTDDRSEKRDMTVAKHAMKTAAVENRGSALV